MLSDIPRDALLRPLTRNEVVGMLVRLTIFGAAAYYSIKWVVEALDPHKSQAKKRAEQLMKNIGVEGVSLTEYEMNIATHLVDLRSINITTSVTWRDVAGLDEIISELQDTVILPFQKRHLFRGSKLLCTIVWATGCGKTLIAKATVKASGCRFINLQASTLTDKWYSESQKLTAAVFSLAVKIHNAINLKEIAGQTEGYSGSDLKELWRDAAMYRVRDYVRKQQMKQIAQQLQLDEEEHVDSTQLRPVTQLYLLFGLDKMRESKQATATADPANLREVPLD
uniref:ATPase family AAA domain containing 1a n=1 Tax=Sinocyclocheilus grahami TaxID=75366 RepID=A0A672LXV9_SINGR